MVMVLDIGWEDYADMEDWYPYTLSSLSRGLVLSCTCQRSTQNPKTLQSQSLPDLAASLRAVNESLWTSGYEVARIHSRSRPCLFDTSRPHRPVINNVCRQRRLGILYCGNGCFCICAFYLALAHLSKRKPWTTQEVWGRTFFFSTANRGAQRKTSQRYRHGKCSEWSVLSSLFFYNWNAVFPASHGIQIWNDLKDRAE